MMSMQGFVTMTRYIYNDHSPHLQTYMRNFLDEVKDEYKLTEGYIRDVCIACEIHDIGKMRIPESIIRKDGILTDRQMAKMKMHPVYGWQILKRNHSRIADCTDDLYEVCKNTILLHHERMNGKGYPFGLIGQDIPLEAKMMAIVDVYDALTMDRCYRKAYSSEEAVEILRSDEGYCQELVESFVRSLERR